MSCAIEGCKSHTGRKENNQEAISFHRFPRNEAIKNEWILRVGRPNWTWNKRSHICSKHFSHDSFVLNENLKWRRLKAVALPTLYLSDTDTLARSATPMDVCDAEHVEVSSRILVETRSNIDVQKNVEIVPVPIMEVCDMESEQSRANTGELDVQKIKRPLEEDTPLSKRLKLTTTVGTSCDLDLDILTNEKISELELEIINLKRRIMDSEKEIERIRKVSKRRLRKINTMTKRISRINKKHSHIFDILIEKLKQENVGMEHISLIESLNENDILKRILQKQGGEPLSRQYSLDLKKFAVTLNYLSPKAYSFIRDQFKNVLPHPKTICAWYKGINCNPGFTAEALDAIRARVAQRSGKIICALAIDEMAIRKFVEWDSHNMNYYGYVNLGQDLNTDSQTLATQALTFMLTSLNDSWKIPVGYFLISSITAQQKAVLVQQCLQLLKDCGVVVASLTYDGAANNMAMASHLGCDMASNAVTFECASSEVCLWPDPCHNLKLVRNAFADKKILIDEDNNIISWEYIELLLKIQEEEGLHLGNKLRKDHVNFVKQKMKVRLAAQLLSTSVADALHYCKEKGIPGFENCEGTVRFLRIFNNLFDIFNSRNLRAKGFKKALATFNFEETERFFATAESYIKKLKTSDGTYLINSNRKTGFNGFLSCMKSLVKMFHNFIMNDSLQYISTYKMSQDHLELFFGAIRAKCGFNNNPSARMFQAAYKRLLVHAQFKDGSSGNCIPLDKITILNCTSGKSVDAINQSCGNIRMAREDTEGYDLTTSHIDLDHNYIYDTQLISEYSADVVNYVAGFIVRKLRRTLKCETCLEALCNNEQTQLFGKVTLISVKDRGGLVDPSKDVTKICLAAEKVIRDVKYKLNSQTVGTRKHFMSIVNKVGGSFIFSNIFNSLIDHSYEQEFEANHRNLLIKEICRLYLTVRIHHLTKQLSEPIDKIRHHLNKTILFKGQ